MYIVLVAFTDLEDNHVYNVGDSYPKKGSKPTDERIEALRSGNNKSGLKLIKEVKSPKRKGGTKPSKK